MARAALSTANPFMSTQFSAHSELENRGNHRDITEMGPLGSPVQSLAYSKAHLAPFLW